MDEKENYEPTPDEISRAEEMMTSEEWRASRERERITGIEKLVADGIIDDKEEKEAIEQKISPEELLTEIEREAMFYLVSRPGTCSHVFTTGFPSFDEFTKRMAEGEYVQGENLYESATSLHVADSSGISTLPLSRDYNPMRVIEASRRTKRDEVMGRKPHYKQEYTPGYSFGFILKPDFLEKMVGSITDDDIERLEQTPAETNNKNNGADISGYLGSLKIVRRLY